MRHAAYLPTLVSTFSMRVRASWSSAVGLWTAFGVLRPVLVARLQGGCECFREGTKVTRMMPRLWGIGYREQLEKIGLLFFRNAEGCGATWQNNRKQEPFFQDRKNQIRERRALRRANLKGDVRGMFYTQRLSAWKVLPGWGFVMVFGPGRIVVFQRLLNTPIDLQRMDVYGFSAGR